MAKKRVYPWQHRRKVTVLFFVTVGIVIAVFFSYRLRWENRVRELIAAHPSMPMPASLVRDNDPSDESSKQSLPKNNGPHNIKKERQYNTWRLLRGCAQAGDNHIFFSDTQWEQVCELLEANQELLDWLLAENRFPEDGFPMEWKMFRTPESRELFEKDGMARLLILQARVAIEQGNIELAFTALDRIVEAAASMQKTPSGYGMMYAGNQFRELSATIQGLLNNSQLNDQQLQRLAGMIGDVDARSSMTHTLLMEREYANQIYDDYSLMSGTKPLNAGEATLFTGARALVAGASLLGYNTRDRAAYLERVNRLLDVSQLSWSEAARPCSAFTREAIDRKGEMKIPSFSIMFDAMAWITVNGAQEIATHTALSQTAIAIERYQLAHGSAPGELQALVPEFLASLPMDPYGGDSIRYRPQGNGYTLYSVFWDGDDDGGIPFESETDGVGEGDRVFHVEKSSAPIKSSPTAPPHIAAHTSPSDNG